MKVAIVHDWLETWGGAESTLVEMLAVFPEAELFALVDFMGQAERARLGNRRVQTSFIQKLPFARRRFRRYLPLFPAAIERLDLTGFDVVLSNSHAVAKGVRTRPSQLHICYCQTPMRYAWDLQESYLKQVGLEGGAGGWAVRKALAWLRRWDVRATTRVTRFVANSRYIAERIRRCYDRDAAVIHPPVDMPVSAETAPRGGTYVTVSRFVPYKRMDLIAAAFRLLPDRELVVIGDGPERARIEAAAGPNVRLLGRVDDVARDRWLAAGRAFIFAAEEDFGIAPLEAQAQGMPVIAFARGGAAETIRGLDDAAPTGVFFDEQTPEAIAAAVRRFEAHADAITEKACRQNAQRFSTTRFRTEYAAFVAKCQTEFASGALAA